MYDNNILDIKQNSIHLEYGVLQHLSENDKQDKTYIFHMAGRDHYTRHELSRKYLVNLIRILYL